MNPTPGEQPNPTEKPEPIAAPSDELKQAAAAAGSVPLWKEFAHFLLHNKKWWLLPIIVILLGLSLLMFLSSTALAPFMYTLF